ncbi:hypothetical protein ABL78_4924 [Leptomonas seymouri]|uniref:Uncharacterized protein n=1 Tax=Leptomonas seymouri TaxID=5684 RepID=A0A0N1I2W2_LEPSE|nr:hypothetical protein ABL78_4924 [Leptomonas seymouri]|eukprot:KPI86021.1 hypothetical protein ABL78_4924 [Leptomonas seymouri]
MYARLSYSPKVTAKLMRGAWRAAVTAGPSVAAAAAASGASSCIASTTARAYHSQSCCLRAPTVKRTAVTSKARTPRRRAPSRVAAASPSPPPQPVKGATPAVNSAGTGVGGEGGAADCLKSSTPPLRADKAESAQMNAEQRRLLRLCDAVREWSALRRHCGRESRCNAAVGASSEVRVAAGSAPATSRSALSLPSTLSAAPGRAAAMLSSGPTSLSRSGSPAEVSMAERTLLLSTLAKEAGTYPQLYALFDPLGHNGGGAKEDAPSASTSQQQQRQSSGCISWEVQGVESLVCSEASTVELLTLLRVHGAVAQRSVGGARLHDTLWDALVHGVKQLVVRDVAVAQRRRSDNRATAEVGPMTSIAQVLHVVVYAYRDQLALGADAATQRRGRSATVGDSTACGKKRGAGPKARRLQKELQLQKRSEDTAVHARVARVLTELAVPLYELDQRIANGARGGDAAVPPLASETPDPTAYGAASTLVMLSALSAVADEAATLLARVPFQGEAPVGCTPPNWCEWREASLARLSSHLEAERSKVGAGAVDSAAAAETAGVFADVLRCLRWTEELEAVLHVSTLRKVEELCRHVLLQACRTADSTGGGMFAAFFCTPSVAAELNRLSPDRVTYAQAFTDICTVAAAFLQRHPDRIPSLVDTLEQEHHAAVAAHFGSSRQLPPRPPLRSPAVQLVYAMLCAGFAASSLLTSDLCLSLSPRDTLEVVRAANLFSLTCGTAPLPVRTRGVLVDQVVQILLQCRKDGHRVVVSSTDEGVAEDGDGSSCSIAARLSDGAAVSCVRASSYGATHAGVLRHPPTGPDTLARRGGRGRGSRSASKKQSSRSAQTSGAFRENAAASAAASAGAVLTPAAYRPQVNHALHVSIESIVECVVRGDTSAVERITLALLPLLQQEGRETALTECLECIWAALRQRLAEMGSSDLTSAPTSPAHGLLQRRMTLFMEEALAMLSSLFLPHMTESAVKALTSNSASPMPSAATTELHGSAHGDGGARAGPLSRAAPLRGAAHIDMALRLTTVSILCGLPAGTVAQLTTLHNSLLKSQGRAAEVASTAEAAAAGPSSTATTAPASERTADPVGAAFAVVERLERLLSDITRQALPWARHAQSPHVRSSGAAVQQVLGAYIASTAAVVRGVTQAATSAGVPDLSSSNRSGTPAPRPTVSARYRHYLLTVVHLLYRLSTEFPVETEPAVLRQFRVEVLDPALTAVLLASPASSKDSTSVINSRSDPVPAPQMMMPLTTLTEVVVVMCVPDSVQYVSMTLMRGVVAAVEQHLDAREQQKHECATSKGSTLPSDTVTGVLATQLLSSAATVCLRADDTLTSMLLQLLEKLGPLLSLWQTATVLERLHVTGAPLSAPPVRVLIERLVTALQDGEDDPLPSQPSPLGDDDRRSAERPRLSRAQSLHILHALSAMQRTADVAVAEQRWSPGEEADATALLRLLRAVPYASLLRSLVQPHLLQHHVYSVAEFGMMVEVVAGLLSAAEADETDAKGDDTLKLASQWTAETRSALGQIPRVLAAAALQAMQLPYDRHDVPQLLRGYAALTCDPQLQQQTLRALISHTIRAAPAMTPSEVVGCVEAYCAGGIVHPQLYGVLLGRAADMGRRLTLELAVRLLRCGTLAGHADVRTVCVTAVQPIFVSQVRGLLQSDPRMLVSVTSTALAILHCLRDCFPHADISAAALANVARYHRDVLPSVVKAALELIEKRGSVDYDVTHVLARHCIATVLPTCTATELANVTCLLLSCGLRSATLLEVVYRRLGEVIETMPGSSLAKLAQGLLRASVEVDTTAVLLICGRVMALASTAAAADGAAEPVTVKREAGRRSTRAGRPQPTGPASAAPSAAVTRPPVPLTLHQVCVVSHLLRSVGRRHVTAVMETVDALLLYAQRRVEADLSVMPPAATDAAVHSAVTTQSAADAAGVGESSGEAEGRAASHSPPLPPPLPVLADVYPQEVEGLLRSCIELSSKPKMFRTLVHSLADRIASLLQQAAAEEELADGSAVLATTMSHRHSLAQRRPHRSPLAACSTDDGLRSGSAASLAWRKDLLLLVDLCSLLIRLGEAQHPAVRVLFDVLYERRGMLLQRALLVKTTKQSLELAGREAHPELYKLMVDGAMV